MSILARKKKPVSKNERPATYLPLEKVRISFVPGTDRIQLTGVMNEKSIKHEIPSGSTLEKELRQELMMHLNASKDWADSEASGELEKLTLPLCFLNFGAGKEISFEEAQKKGNLYQDRSATPYIMKNFSDIIVTAEELQIPLGLAQNLYNPNIPENYFYKPYLPSNTPEPNIGEINPKKNIFLAGLPGKGKTETAKTIIKSVQSLDPEIDITFYNPAIWGLEEATEYGIPVVQDLLELTAKMRHIRDDRSDPKKRFLVVLEEMDTLIQFPYDGSHFDKRVNTALRAEILQSIIFMSHRYPNVSFVFCSQSPTPEHNGIIDTCGTIIDFGSSPQVATRIGIPKEYNYSRMHNSGFGYIKGPNDPEPKKFQAYRSVNID